MTEQEQNIAIAEFCGLQYYKPTEKEFKSGSYYQFEPDYLNDLNAIHEAEEYLTIDQTHFYLRELENITGGRLSVNSHMIQALVVHATAKQRAEALLKTIGKWKEE